MFLRGVEEDLERKFTIPISSPYCTLLSSAEPYFRKVGGGAGSKIVCF